ncbi:acyltransferase family protein [Arthrobacter sp. NPDC058127]|uniref:acyltransferase family protein n=1 Tax=Arthrobacter sp. NPDC058127 TaxID=3346351 RepID=UPI0036E9700C
MRVSSSRAVPLGESTLDSATATPSVRPAAKNRSGFRPDIQALRALAVSFVVLGHLWPKLLPGGYVGVDAFFVISGFLITAHLSKEVFATGRLDFAAFYSRRIRRLLPAAFVVLAVSLVAAAVILPFSRWGDTAQQVLASAIYGENWVLAANAVDYSASTSSATVAQHYWSLSVEEQFYLFWPLLLVGLAWGAKLLKARPRWIVAAGIGAASLVSLALSSHYADMGRHEAYFYTPVRLWEFGVGAILALVVSRLRFPRAVCGPIVLLGFGGLLASALLFNAATPFPGTFALLPVLGTALVIAGGTPGHRFWHSRLISWKPVQFLGNISYSLYLWHWPLIVVGPFLISAELRTPAKLVLLAISVALAWATKVWVEDKGIAFRPQVRPALKTVLAMVVGIVVVGAGCGGLELGQTAKVAAAEESMLRQKTSVCYGPSSMDHPTECPDRFGPAATPIMSDANAYFKTPSECTEPLDILLAGDKKTTRICDFSGGAANPQTIWLVGDSHAQQWQGPIFDLAKRNKWVVKISFDGACPPAAVSYVGYYSSVANQANVDACRNWGREVSDAIKAERPQYVFTAAFARKERVDDGSGRSQNEQYAEGFGKYWESWTSVGTEVRVLSDPPYNVDVRSSDCVQLNAKDPVRCAVDRGVADPEDPMSYAARVSHDPKVRLIDLTRYFCDAKMCYSVVGGVVVYYDVNHLNLEFSQLLAPMIQAKL